MRAGKKDHSNCHETCHNMYTAGQTRDAEVQKALGPSLSDRRQEASRRSAKDAVTLAGFAADKEACEGERECEREINGKQRAFETERMTSMKKYDREWRLKTMKPTVAACNAFALTRWRHEYQKKPTSSPKTGDKYILNRLVAKCVESAWSGAAPEREYHAGFWDYKKYLTHPNSNYW